MELPECYKSIVGTEKIMGGGLFSSKKEIQETKYSVLDWRWGSAKIINMDTLEFLHPTVEFLVKNKTMKRSRWTRGFPVKEIKLDESN